MKRVVVICCFVAVCAGVVLAGASISPQVAQSTQATSVPVAQVEAGAGFLLEFSTLGLLGVGAVSLFVCRKRKRL